jgi:hypothetical protein
VKLRAKIIAVAIAAAAAATAVAPTAANAALSDCPAGRFCIFENSSGTGHWAYFQIQAENLADPGFLNGYLNDRTSAVYNRRGEAWCLYQDAYFTGPSIVIDAVTTYKSLGGTNWDNRVSSLRKMEWVSGRGGGQYSCYGY